MNTRPGMIARSRGAAMTVVVSILTILVATAITFSPASAGEWKGTTSKSPDGHLIVSSPATGCEAASTTELQELWRLGGDTDDENEFFGVIADIQIDDAGNVYLMDAQLNEIKVYSADGEYLRTIGREGEGPGEFRAPLSMMLTKDGNVAVVLMVPGKIVLLSPEGAPLGEMPIPQREDGGYQMLSGGKSGAGNIVLYLRRDQFDQGKGLWSSRSSLISINETGEQIAEYCSKDNAIDMANAKMNNTDFDTFERRWTVGPDGKVYSCNSFPDYAVNVYGKDGTLEKVIRRDYKHRALSSEEHEFTVELMTAMTKQIPNCKIEINPNAKDVENIYVRDDGSIWVLTSNGMRDVEDGILGNFDVYNPEGHFVRTISLAGDGDPKNDMYLFVRDRFYVITDFLQASMTARGVTDVFDEEDEPEPMAIICYKLDRDLLASAR